MNPLIDTLFTAVVSASLFLAGILACYCLFLNDKQLFGRERSA
mgnify:CR=1 FL=1